MITHDERPWVVMELTEGANLSEVIKKDGPLPGCRTAEIGLAVLDALTEAESFIGT